jgi:uncharacterized protein (UPF0333 family)
MSEEKAEKRKPKRKLRLLLPAGFLLIVIAVIVLIIKNMNGPAEGKVAYVSQSQSAIKPTTATSKQYDGKYISFTYPEHYKIVPSQQSSGYLDIVSINNTDHSGKYISIGVLRESLANDSGVNYRKAHPELYKQVSASSDKIIYESTGDKAEKTGFVAHGGLVTTISITANGSRDLSQDFEVIANSLQWKQ